MNRNSLQKQNGTTILLSLVFLVGLIAAIGLATDSGHLMVNKTRLQNALDSTALSAAITLNADPNRLTNPVAATDAATAQGKTTFNLFIGSQGNSELSGISTAALTFEYSRSLSPFVSATTPPTFVRVSTNALSVSPILIRILPALQNPINVSAVSTAGPVGQNCTLVPFVMCAQMTPSLDTNCLDDTDNDGMNDCFGYNLGETRDYIQACEGNLSCPPNSPLEAGTFTLVDLTPLPGSHDISQGLQETRDICLFGHYLSTDHTYDWDDIKQGIDARFDSDDNQAEYPPGASPSPYTQYEASATGNDRRVIAVPITDCREFQNGDLDPLIKGTGCLFLTERTIDNGTDKQVMAEFIGTCQQNGEWNPVNAVLNGPYKIVILKTEGSGDS